MNNKGFIATSLIYSFFLVFVAVMASILATYAHNRILVNNVNEGIVDDLNTTVSEKYLVIKNILQNSDFEESGSWSLSNAAITVVPDPIPDPLPEGFKIISYRGMKSLKINPGNSDIREENLTLEKDHYYYLRYYIFRNGPIGGTSRFTLEGPATYDFNLSFITPAIYANWDLKSNIIPVLVAGNYTLRNVNTGISGDFVDLNIDSLMLIDVTELVNVSGSVATAKDYLDTFDYFEGAMSITKP